MKRVDLRLEARLFAPLVPEPGEHREAAIATWQGRMVNETLSASVFTALGRQLAWAGFGAPVAAACEEFSREERRHGVLCGAVVEALGGEAIAELPDVNELPLHEDVSPLEGAIRNVLSVCCLSETVAVALIGAERADMPRGELHDLLTRIWADEIGHSRFGWRLVERFAPTSDVATRARLGAYLRIAFRALEDHELDHLPLGRTEEVPELGVCDGRSARALFYATVTEVIVPRLEALGLPARAAWDLRRRDVAELLARSA
ncbi:MAG TPA: ferritin-like domain-containing protein [Polyangiaceae bacterium]|nr:ferritin-like domain-containing protein [Polyangiaceae bacterium]